MRHELRPPDLPEPWAARLREYAALQRQRRYAAQARVQHHATCACRPGRLCLVGEELRSWEAGIEVDIARYQQRYGDAPPPLRPSWLSEFQLWYAALLRAQRLPTAGAVSPLEQQDIERQVEEIGQALHQPNHAQHTPACWLYEAWLATYYGDEPDHADP